MASNLVVYQHSSSLCEAVSHKIAKCQSKNLLVTAVPLDDPQNTPRILPPPFCHGATAGWSLRSYVLNGENIATSFSGLEFPGWCSKRTMSGQKFGPKVP